jgi:NAD(P)-dependent dehydrogenase (short-subunit alcohol dehydrogenase family)
MSKNVLITGASRGIGAASARLLASQGWRVCINYRNQAQAAEQLAEEITRAGGQALTVAADVSQADEVRRLFEFVDRQLGPLHALVNNAGVIAPMMRLEQMEPARWSHIIGTNLLGTMMCAREGVLRMSTRRGGTGGAIVNLSTALTRSGAPGMYIDYAAAKSGVETLTVGLAREVAGDGVRVNCVRPGLIDTEIHASGGDAQRADKAKDFVPLRRAGQAQEVAQAIAWLLSDQASYTTGSFIDVSGGL